MARKILLADDSVTAQNMGRKILTDAGYEVVTVNNGSAALKKISECKPSVVVLDVYMPGYSGLEVCARIKEGRDTEGIPVLLTVGKLEPFRQDEAHKVHADAFIIKPFEASELLAALNKLEAKSGNHHPEPAVAAEVPKPAPAPDSRKPAADSKSNKHVAPTMARYEREVADGAPRFGDHESGWKARLTMPSPGARHEEADEEPEIATMSSRPRNWDEPADRPSFAVTQAAADATPTFEGLPGDVTPDELAAIAAAAAAVGGANTNPEIGSTIPEQVAPASEPETPTSIPVTFASETQPQEPALPSTANGSAGPVSAQVEAVFTSFAATHPTEAAESQKIVSAPARETIAAVAPAESKVVAMSARWVAEEVPVGAAESALVLEQEMQKAFAAFAAAETGSTYQPGPVNGGGPAPLATIAPPDIGTPTPFSEPVQSVAEPETATASAELQTPEQTYSSQSVSEVTEPVMPPAPPFSPVSAEETNHAVVAFGEPHPFAAAEVEETVSAEPTTLEPATSRDAVASAPASSTLPDDWHDLRQPAAKADGSADKTNSNFEDFSDKSATDRAEIQSKIESAMAAAASGDSSTSSSADNALSSIVDNMLAELKPKLMAELAKKLDKK